MGSVRSRSILEEESKRIRNSLIRLLFRTGKYTQSCLGRVFGLRQSKIRYILSPRSRCEEQEVSTLSSRELRSISKAVHRRSASYPEETLELALYLRDTLGFSQSQIGARLGKTQSAVCYLLQKAERKRACSPKRVS